MINDRRNYKNRMKISEAMKLSDEIYIGFHTKCGYIQFQTSKKQLRNACHKIASSVRILDKSKNNKYPPADWELNHNDILIIDFLDREMYRNVVQ